MATLALFAVGSAVGSAIGGTGVVAFGLTAGAIGGAIGGLAGGFIDSQLIFPALFKNNASFTGPRIDDLTLQTASEGSPIRVVIGRNNKFAGTVIWLSDLIEEVTTSSESAGGKGGGGGGSVTTTTYRYYVSLAVAVCEGPIFRIKEIYADSKKIYDATNGKDHRSASISIYTGTNSQTPNALLESYEGAGNVPAYRGISYVVIERLALADFGNRVPNLQFVVEQTATDTSLADALFVILTRAGLDPSEFDLSLIPAVDVLGYTLTGPISAAQALEPLVVAYDIAVRESGNAIKFYIKNQEDGIAVEQEDLASHEFGTIPPQPLTLIDTSGFEMVNEVDIKYLDIDQNMQSGAQRARRINKVTDSVETVDLPISMRAEDARKIAERRLWTQWSQRQGGAVTLPPSFIHAEEGDNLSVIFEGELYVLRIREINRGSNYLHEIRGTIVETQTGVQVGPVDPSVYVPPTLYQPSPIELALLQIPALIEAHINTPGFYYAMAIETPPGTWLGAGLFESLDDLVFSQVGFSNVQMNWGALDGDFEDADANPYTWDNTNVITVDLSNGSLASVTEAECLAGKNRLVVGREIVGFQNATLVSPGKYELSKLLRGLRDTEIATHIDGTIVTVLDASFIQLRQYSSGEIGQTRYYRPVAVGEDVLAVSSQTETLDAVTCRPFSPEHFEGVKSGNDWVFSWVRRSRAFCTFPGNCPLDEPFERYEIDILDGVDIVRTIVVNSATTATYTEAQQIADFGSAQSSVDAVVYQIGNIYGRGNPREGSF